MPRQLAGPGSKESVFLASKAAYITLVGMFGGLSSVSLFCAVFLHPTFWTAVTIFFFPLAISAAWLQYFRIVLSDESITYRTLFAGTANLRWNEIATAEMRVGYLRNEPGGLFRPPFRLILNSKDQGKSDIIINVKMLSRVDLSDLIQTVKANVDVCKLPKSTFWQ